MYTPDLGVISNKPVYYDLPGGRYRADILLLDGVFDFKNQSSYWLGNDLYMYIWDSGLTSCVHLDMVREGIKRRRSSAVILGALTLFASEAPPWALICSCSSDAIRPGMLTLLPTEHVPRSFAHAGFRHDAE